MIHTSRQTSADDDDHILMTDCELVCAVRKSPVVTDNNYQYRFVAINSSNNSLELAPTRQPRRHHQQRRRTC